MCTLIAGWQVLGPDSLLVATNRDEDPRRPSDPPAELLASPRVIGGRDRVARGTWLAVREARAVVAMLNRRWNGAAPTAAAANPRRRSRGLLTLDVAAVDAGPSSRSLAAAALARACAALEEADYDPFSLAFLTPSLGWVLTHEPGRAPADVELRRGWHVLTHADLDDDSEPRTAWLKRELRGLRAGSLDEIERALFALLSTHAGDGRPAVCIHEGRMLTVSSSIVALTPTENHYRHVEGRPCERGADDFSDLLRSDREIAKNP